MTPKEKIERAMEFTFANRPQVGGFPFLAECLRLAGVKSNIWSLPSAQSVYIMDDSSWLINQGDPIQTGLIEVPKFDRASLVQAIRTDQAGESTFPEFLDTVWQAGVVGYDVAFGERIVTYRGAYGEVYTENYPEVKITGLNFD